MNEANVNTEKQCLQQMQQKIREEQLYENAKVAYNPDTYAGQTQGIGLAGERRPTLREEAEKNVGYHRSQADKANRAAAFFREHPEFDEFIQLIRSGVIGI